ncbi:hypothetical protein DMC25_08570 [Caulobacter sp. D4A]|nr:hypothetical protein DMC25_08570 [Caulobacter sp. D4A]PXA95002.1 hypothetical protein DMC18_05005 [Caulobacter sp. D5]
MGVAGALRRRRAAAAGWFENLILLPLREKVSPQATDEGSLRPVLILIFAAAPTFDPSSDLLRRPPSPARGEGLISPTASGPPAPRRARAGRRRWPSGRRAGRSGRRASR